jgi:hypothetical protein
MCIVLLSTVKTWDLQQTALCHDCRSDCCSRSTKLNFLCYQINLLASTANKNCSRSRDAWRKIICSALSDDDNRFPRVNCLDLAPLGKLPTTTYHEEYEAYAEIHSENRPCHASCSSWQERELLCVPSSSRPSSWSPGWTLDRLHQVAVGCLWEAFGNLLHPGLREALLGCSAGEPGDEFSLAIPSGPC